MIIKFFRKLLIILIIAPCAFGDLVNINLLLGYSNQMTLKGAPVWSGPVLIAGPAFTFFDNQLQLAGPGLNWNFFGRESQHQLKTGIRYSDDSRPWIRLDDSKVTYRNSRKSTILYSFEYRYQFGWNNKFHLGVYFEKELKEYKGVYSEVEFSVPVIPFTSLANSLSFAESSSNKYAYGEEAKSGVGYYKLSLNNFFPFTPWKGRIITTLRREVIVSGAARHADLVRGDYKNWVFMTMWFWDIY